MMQILLNVLEPKLAGVLTSPVLQGNTDRTRLLIARHIVARVAAVAGNRLSTHVLQFHLTPLPSVSNPGTIIRRQNRLVANHVRFLLRERHARDDLLRGLLTKTALLQIQLDKLVQF